MIYPICVHKDPDSAYGVTIPDFPGCFSAADELEDLPRMVQEAIEVHFEGEEGDIPLPSPVEAFLGAPEYEGGFWMFVDVDLSRVSTKSIRLNISLPACLVSRIDRYAAEHRESRSGFLARAAMEEMRRAH
jgi:predicted RNase H-like HicB family nuclease